MSSEPAPGTPHIPGELGVWVFIFGDMLIFGLLFATFMFYRADDPALYIRSQLSLNRNFGALNTILLLSSSWFVAMAVQYAKAKLWKSVPIRLLFAMACGLGFVAVKIAEYSDKLASGITPATNDFYMFYFVLTGVHFFHLLLGLAVLGYMWNRFRHHRGSSRDLSVLESGASFWHLIDLLWIVLFPLLYLVR